MAVDGTHLVYSTPENQKGTLVKAEYQLDEKELSSTEIEYTHIWTGKLGDRRLHLEAKRGNCSDGMSDTVYPYVATLTIAGKTERGCARRR